MKGFFKKTALVAATLCVVSSQSLGISARTTEKKAGSSSDVTPTIVNKSGSNTASTRSTYHGKVTLYGTPENAIKKGPVHGSKVTIDLGTKEGQSFNNVSFTIPQVEEYFELNDGWEIDYVSVSGNSSGKRQPGGSFLLSMTGGSMVYYFKRATQNITLSFSANGGSGAPASLSQSVNVGSNASFTIPSKTPTRAGYTFLGWSESSSASAASYQPGQTYRTSTSKTLYAVWEKEPEKETITLSYNANGGTGAPASESQTVVKGQQAHFVVSSVKPVREGYTFLGWNVNPQATTVDWSAGDSMNTVASCTLYAVWQKEPQKHNITLTYDANGGTGAPASESREVTEGQSAEFTVKSDVPSKDKHTFLGWADTSDAATANYQAGSVITTDKDKTIYAVWSKIPETFTITYTDGVDGEVIFEDQTYTATEGQKTPPFVGEPKRDGYIFKGWAPAVSETVTGNQKYEAIWAVDESAGGDTGDDKKESVPSMDKVVVDDEGTVIENPSLKPGQTVDFRLNTTVPGNFYNYVEFVTDGTETKLNEDKPYLLTIHDAYAETFTLNEDSIVVKIGETELNTSQYTIEKNPNDCKNETEVACKFHIVLNLNKLYNDQVLTHDHVKQAAPITVDYKMTLDEKATVQPHVNKAWVTSKEPTFITDIVEVDVFGIKVTKFDTDSNKLLPGAAFTLYAADKTTEVGKGETDANGMLTFTGLEAGTYYLLETKAPSGYIRSTEYIEINVNNDADLDDGIADNYVNEKVGNKTAPHTGGAGTMLYTAGGTALIAGSLLIAVMKKKKESK